jgi:hypothetical protein
MNAKMNDGRSWILGQRGSRYFFFFPNNQSQTTNNPPLSFLLLTPAPVGTGFVLSQDTGL